MINPFEQLMANKKSTARSKRVSDMLVDEYLAALEHPHKKGVQALRKAILGIDTMIREEIKWNAPSFYLEDHFATFRLHPGSTLQLILHTGAKAKDNQKQFLLDDPHGIVKWAAKDRCIIAFKSDEDVVARLAEVARMVKEWISQL